MKDLITMLVRPSPPLPEEITARLASVSNWGTFCALAAKTECAPLIYERLSECAHAVPQEVLDRLRRCHQATAAANMRLLDELWAVDGLLATRGIRALTLKGPVLASLGAGLRIRMFHDLDLLVRPDDFGRAAEALRLAQYTELQTGAHDYHRIFAKLSAPAPPIVELHFGLIDRPCRYVPDLEGIWRRAKGIDILDRQLQTADVTDHLLLTIMQLPHHHWSPRLLVDVGHLAVRQAHAIDWAEIRPRARAWGMRVLAASVLHAAASLLRFTLPPKFASCAKPENYVQRVQWRLVRDALSARLGLGAPSLGRAPRFLILDQPGAALTALVHRSLGTVRGEARGLH